MTSQSFAAVQILEYKSSRIYICTIDDRFLLWIESSQRFLMIEEPVYVAVEELSKGGSLSEIASLFVLRYQFSLDECTTFVADVASRIDALLSETPPFISSNLEFNPATIPLYSYVSNYNLDGKILKLSFQTERLRHLIHPLFAHLETSDNVQSVLGLELFESNGSLCLHSGDSIVTCWQRDDIPHFKGEVLGQMLNLIYAKANEDWMMTMHASGVTNGENSILFSAEAGAGKSTLAALMQASGYGLLSDDFIVVDLVAKAYRFDMAMSVKSGAISALVESYPALKNIEPQLASNGKDVCFLPPNKFSFAKSTFPITAIVFVEYNPTVDCLLREIAQVDAIQRLLSEIYVTPNAEAVMQFMNFVQSTKFYTLQYSNNDAAINQINNLFQYEK